MKKSRENKERKLNERNKRNNIEKINLKGNMMSERIENVNDLTKELDSLADLTA